VPLRWGDVIDLIEFRLALRAFVPAACPPWPSECVSLCSLNRGWPLWSRQAHQIPLAKPVIKIGRASDNDVVLDHPQVSRHHAQVTQAVGRSPSLTRARQRSDVQRLARPQRLLAEGDVITIGGTTWRCSSVLASAPAGRSQAAPAAAPAKGAPLQVHPRERDASVAGSSTSKAWRPSPLAARPITASSWITAGEPSPALIERWARATASAT